MQGFWMHENILDVCVNVLKVRYEDAKCIKIKVEFWNLGYVGNPYNLDITKTITIVKPIKWIKLSKDQMQTIRIKPGPPSRD